MNTSASILVVEDDEFVGNSLKWLLADEGYHVEVAADGKRALEVIEQSAFDLVITDLRMPDVDGLEVLRQVKRISPLTPVIVLTGYGTVESALSALEAGAFDFLTKPCDDLEMKFKIINALTMKELRTDLDRFRTISVQDRQLLSAVREAMLLLAQRPDCLSARQHLVDLCELLDGQADQASLERCLALVNRLRES